MVGYRKVLVAFVGMVFMTVPFWGLTNPVFSETAKLLALPYFTGILAIVGYFFKKNVEQSKIEQPPPTQ